MKKQYRYKNHKRKKYFLRESLSTDELRKQFWIDAWLSVARAESTKEPEAATRWADKGLDAFDERFK